MSLSIADQVKLCIDTENLYASLSNEIADQVTDPSKKL